MKLGMIAMRNEVNLCLYPSTHFNDVLRTPLQIHSEDISSSEPGMCFVFPTHNYLLNFPTGYGGSRKPEVSG
jgi:hypothetical protein